MGVLEVMAKVNQKQTSVILDTGSCVSCIDETLVAHLSGQVSPVQGVNAKTAIDEPVQILGRTEIVLRVEIGQCALVFPVFVARGVGGCCYLGNDFNLKYGTTIDFARRKAKTYTPQW